MRQLSIKQRRIALGLTQKDLADKMGVDQSAVTLWEKGSGPLRSRLPELAKVLDCSIEELLKPDEEE